jgi:hypothetical protein
MTDRATTWIEVAYDYPETGGRIWVRYVNPDHDAAPIPDRPLTRQHAMAILRARARFEAWQEREIGGLGLPPDAADNSDRWFRLRDEETGHITPPARLRFLFGRRNTSANSRQLPDELARAPWSGMSLIDYLAELYKAGVVPPIVVTAVRPPTVH